jgi:hypothetical protein
LKTSPKKENKVTALDRAQINELLAESIGSYVSKVKTENKNIEDSVEKIDNYLSEYLTAFMVFGYDMKGNPICMHHAINQMDSDALNSLINRSLFKGME